MNYLFLLILSMSFNVFSQDDYTGIQLDSQRKKHFDHAIQKSTEREPTGLELDSKGKKVGNTSEWSYTYIRFAQSSISFSEKEKGSSLTLGHRQVAETFYYDLQYSKIDSNKSKIKINLPAMGLGWQANWNHRLLPYLGAQLGYSIMNSKHGNETGFYTGIDAGVILKRYYPFLFLVGTRYGIHNYSSEKVNDIKVQEFYISIGLELF